MKTPIESCAPPVVIPHGACEPAFSLQLIPLSEGVPPVFISARASIRIGRATRRADVVTRFLPETAQNARLTSRLGRIHVIGRRVNGWPCFWDGDGEDPSTNGAWLDGKRLDFDAGARIQSTSTLRLGREYELQAVCQKDEAACFPKNEPTSETSVIFLPAKNHQAAGLFAWMGNSLALHANGTGLEWPLDAAHPPLCALLFAEGGFWIANLALAPENIRLQDKPLAQGKAAPLHAGEVLQLGPWGYRVACAV